MKFNFAFFFFAYYCYLNLTRCCFFLLLKNYDLFIINKKIDVCYEYWRKLNYKYIIKQIVKKKILYYLFLQSKNEKCIFLSKIKIKNLKNYWVPNIY